MIIVEPTDPDGFWEVIVDDRHRFKGKVNAMATHLGMAMEEIKKWRDTPIGDLRDDRTRHMFKIAELERDLSFKDARILELEGLLEQMKQTMYGEPPPG